jgi:2-iminobutanoate/2-iminopropanoate deaminase
MEDAKRREIHTDRAPAAVGPYAQAIEAGGFVYTAGQVGLDPDTGELAGDDLATQARQAMDNLEAVLEAAGLGMGDVVKTTIFLTDVGAFGTVNEIYGDRLEAPYPARSTVEVSRLPKDALVEIEAVARRPDA